MRVPALGDRRDGARERRGRVGARRGVARGIGRCDVVCARALAALPVLCEYAAPLLRDGGAARGVEGRVSAEEEAADATRRPRSSALSADPVRPVAPFAGLRTADAARPAQGRAHAGASTRGDREWPPNARCLRKPCAESAPRACRTALRAARSAARAASVGRRHGHRVRHRQPEGRGREDHDRRQRRRVHRGGRLRDAARRRRPAGQRHGRASAPTARTALGLYDVLSGEAEVRDAVRATGVERLSLLASTPDLAGATMELPRLPGLRDAPARRARARARRVRVHAARLPAVARAADRQRARRGGPRHRARSDRVLRARGPRRAARHARADPARAQSRG